MRLPLDGIDFEEKFDYYFVNRYGELSHFHSNKKLQIGTIIFLDAFPADLYLFKVSNFKQVEDKTVVELESCRNEVALCDQTLPNRYKHAFKTDK